MKGDLKRNMEQNEIRQILIKLQFNINSKGFDYWIQAIHLYTTFNEKIKMTELYEQLAFEFITNADVIERNMRTSSKTAHKNIQEYFNYDNKITNKAILQLFRFYEDRRKNE